MSEWRYLAQRFDGEGLGDFIHTDLPLTDPAITDNLTGDNELSATIDPVWQGAVADDGRPLFEEWGTVIYAEHQDEIRGAGILINSGFDGPSWALDCVGFTGYLADLPYVSEKFFVEADALDIFRHIWNHAQGQPGSNWQLEVDPVKSGKLIGRELEQVEFDTVSGPVSFEAGPYKLATYMTPDLSRNAVELAEDTPFDWLERHYWDGDVVRHRLQIGVPRIGRKRDDLRFAVGENILVPPPVDRDGSQYADQVLVLGSGDGSAQKRALSPRINTGRARRTAVVVDSSLRSEAACLRRAKAEVQNRARLEDISNLTVIDHPHAPLGSVSVGDTITLSGRTDWIDLNGLEVRIISRTISPNEPDSMSLGVVRTDRLTF